MLLLLCIVVLLGVVVIGDIVWFELTEALWNLGQKLPQYKLNFDKRRRPQRRRWHYC